jgi:hypothetical protein
MKKIYVLFFSVSLLCFVHAEDKITSVKLLVLNPSQYEKTEFNIIISSGFKNPYTASDIELDMHLTAPSGKELFVPCFYVSGDTVCSLWKARFAAQEAGTFTYSFQLIRNSHKTINSDTSVFTAVQSSKNGFLHTDGLWTLKYDSGKLFRGIGENVAWESRSFENPKWTYDYFLPKLAREGANFFRTWMCSWNLPLEWQMVSGTGRYMNTAEYYNSGGIERMDQLIGMTDSLGMHIMLTLDSGGSLWHEFWCDTGSTCKGSNNPADFFTRAGARQRYKDKLRYLVARWGYSPGIAAFEFFNEIDNSAYTPSPEDSVIIPHEAVVEWHSEMSRYLHDIDPYHHIITTSISHRDIIGMNMLPYIDINQKHIYKNTEGMRSEILRYTRACNKPYIIGEFGFEWDWTIDFSTIASGLEYDFQRGLWYGLFSPTPILPMSWWWEFFDEHNMTPYFKSVREISDQMLEAGKGSFEILDVKADIIEAYGLKCGDKLFVYLLNNSNSGVKSKVMIKIAERRSYNVQGFMPAKRTYRKIWNTAAAKEGLLVPAIKLASKESLILILSPKK